MKLTNEAILKDIEAWFAKRKDIPWSNEDRILLKCQLYIQGLEKESKPLSDEEILKCWYEYGQMLTIEQIRIAFGRAIEAKVRGEK